MDKIAHRELRNHSAEILRRVGEGASFEVTNNGRAAALIVPLTDSRLARLELSGQVRPPSRTTLPRVARVRADVSIVELLDELKGER
ncbi:MAG: type II toxin-antitoxin system prevent-host-death family antitoxin [Actinomycetales bacterium]|nr:type II toxin-antitoxin system prevent-host-death family antitoxin [Actinomycetales bacterium]